MRLLTLRRALLGGALLLAGCTKKDAPSCPAPVHVVDGGYGLLAIQGDAGSAQGVADPSIVYPADATGGVMAYSSVPILGLVHTRVAVSSDHGATWTYAGDVNQVDAATVDTSDPWVCGAASCTGAWVHEVPSLVVDPADAAAPFKIFTFTYFVSAVSGLQYAIGYIGLHTAPSVTGPWTATRLLGWNSSSSESSSGVVQNVNLDPALAGLADCVALTEPGATIHVTASSQLAIDLAVGCVHSGGIDVRLLRSLDHGASWMFVSRLLSSEDATALGSADAIVNAPDLFTANGSTYLFASIDGPVNLPTVTANGYTRCLLFEVADVDAGQLRRCGVLPVVVSSFSAAPGQMIGACSWAEGASAGGVVGVYPEFSATPTWRIFRSPTGPL